MLRGTPRALMGTHQLVEQCEVGCILWPPCRTGESELVSGIARKKREEKRAPSINLVVPSSSVVLIWISAVVG